MTPHTTPVDTAAPQLPKEVEKRFDEKFSYQHHVYSDGMKVISPGRNMDSGTWQVFTSDQIKQFLAQELHTLEQKHRAELERIKSVLYMYTHQWTGDDIERFCENCREVVEKWTVCDASNLKAKYLASDLLTVLTTTTSERKAE